MSKTSNFDRNHELMNFLGALFCLLSRQLVHIFFIYLSLQTSDAFGRRDRNHAEFADFRFSLQRAQTYSWKKSSSTNFLRKFFPGVTRRSQVRSRDPRRPGVSIAPMVHYKPHMSHKYLSQHLSSSLDFLTSMRGVTSEQANFLENFRIHLIDLSRRLEQD